MTDRQTDDMIHELDGQMILYMMIYESSFIYGFIRTKQKINKNNKKNNVLNIQVN